MLRCQSVVDIERNQITIQAMNNALAEIVIISESAKYPATAVEVNIGCPSPWLTLFIKPRFWLEDPNYDFTAINRTFLLCYTEDVRARSSAIGDSELSRVLAILFYWNLMCVKPPCIECIVVCDVYRVIPTDKLWGNAIVEGLNDCSNSKLMQSWTFTASFWDLGGHVQEKRAQYKLSSVLFELV